MADKESVPHDDTEVSAHLTPEQIASGMAALLINEFEDGLMCPGVVPDERTEAWAKKHFPGDPLESTL